MAHLGQYRVDNPGALERGAIGLGGEWEFYWNQLLTPDEFAAFGKPRLTKYLSLPAAWTDTSGTSNAISGRGVATFRLRVTGLPPNRELALFVPEQATAYRLWFNGVLAASNGVPARVRTRPDPKPSPQLARVSSRTGDAEVVLQIANHHTARGGPIHTLQLGLAQELEGRWLRLRYLDALLFGSLTVMALYHLGLFRLRRRDTTSLYVAVTSLAFALRIPFNGLSGRPIVDLFGHLPWELPQRLQAALTLWGIAAVPMYMASLVRGQRWRSVLKFAAILYGALGVGALVVSRMTSTSSHTAALAAHFVLSGLLLIATLREIRCGTPYTLQMLLGWAFLAPLGFAEIALSSPGGMGTSLALMPFGVFLFLLAHSWLAAFRLDATFSAVESLSTELKHKNDELTRIEKLKDDFLANTSHELRTPLHGIVGLTESLLREVAGPLPERARESLRLVVASGRRLTSLIGDILDLTRLRRGDVQLRLRKVDLHSLTMAVLALLEPIAQAKQLTLTNDVSSAVPPVLGDEDRLHQVLLNLVHNAIKFTETGTVEVSAGVYENTVVWTVRDSGVGIAVDRLQTVFEAYEKHAGDGSGMGLGLNIVRQLVQLHHGSISAETRPEGGTVFTMRLPKWDDVSVVPRSLPADERFIEYDAPSSIAVGPSNVEVAPTTTGTDDSHLGLAGANVLVVDDDPINLRVAAEKLRFAGATVSTAATGEQALELVARESASIDVVLLDVMMPGITGFQVTERLRNTHDALSLPVILLTARAQPEDLALGFAVGANDYLAKPFTDVELMARCRLHLDLKRSFHSAKQAMVLERELEQQRHQMERTNLCLLTAELEKLRYQINPHLLFNTLTSIRGAMRSNGTAAREMIVLLAEYYRSTLTTGSRGVIALSEELRMTELFLAIERARQQRAESVDWEIGAETKDYAVPTLVLQPLVENAIKYGRQAEHLHPVRLCIAARLNPNGALLLSVSNAGTWRETASDTLGGTSIGLKNVRQRLTHYYGNEATLEHDAHDGWVQVTLSLPRPARESQQRGAASHIVGA